ncbi:SRPBCC family protein [Piscibacillus halophilus]|uniref:Polyketide cyclase / dehydrase and lipid transport n=1 Tax=Piscibacillus halophilus TaxID=571933 RepID=A0A1H9FUY8_9BACI|nr:SRPBCC family protein [Piscibacillus halophilus]SEQ41740.1 Polyketide cyclase / dehydrase and lipid transport [Piscibacillus halophilus]
MGFKRDVHIKYPIDLVFRVLTTFEYAPKVLDHIQEVEVLDEEVKVGTHIKEVRLIGNQQVENTLEVTEYEPYTKFATYSKQNGLDLHYIYTLSEVDGGTDIHFEGNIKTKGLRNMLTKPVINRIIKKEDGNHLYQLKQYVEMNYKESQE